MSATSGSQWVVAGLATYYPSHRPRLVTGFDGDISMAIDGATAFRALLHNYVLWCIDQLDEDKRLKLDAIAPKLARSFRRKGSWQDIVAIEMDFPPNMPDVIRGLWQRNLQRFQEAGESPDPNVFAATIVEENFMPVKHSQG
jgi:hypothetical protein